jgi:hypothetical protein
LLRERIDMKRLCLLTALAFLAALGSTSQVALTADAAVPSCDSWSPPTPNVGSLDNELHGVTFRSSCDGWAVGMYRSGGFARTLIEHWNGTRWVVVPSPSPGSDNSYAPSLSGVSATSSSDAWAVGAQLTGGQYQTLIEHWDGHSWTVQASKNPGGPNRQNSLTGVAALSPTNVWAVGTYQVAGGTRTLTEHWNGTSWSVVATPNPGSSYNTLQGISAVSAADIWAVGAASGSGASYQVLTVHWDGAAWSDVPAVSPGGTGQINYLTSVAARSASSVWAVGYYATPGNPDRTLIEHWNGHTWTVQASPNPGGTGRTNTLTGVAAAGSEAWAVGTSAAADIRTVLLHFSAGVWRQQKTPNPQNVSRLIGVAAIPSAGAWAVGLSGLNPSRTLVMHSAGDCEDLGTQPPGAQNTTGLQAISAATNCTAWAVGSTQDESPHNSSPTHGFIAHWNGKAWSSSQAPFNSWASELNGVAATGPSNAWAVGEYSPDGVTPVELSLILYWNGSAWSQQSSPNPDGITSGGNYLADVAAVSASNAWAVGSLLHSRKVLVAHWDGSFWVQQTTPEHPGPGVSYQTQAVAATSSRSAFLVGYVNGTTVTAFAERWNGSSWTLLTGVATGTLSRLYDVTAVSASDAWAVGDYVINGKDRPLVEHWNGTGWTRFTVPLPTAATAASLNGVTSSSASDAWAVGSYGDSHGSHILIEHWNGSTWNIEAAPAGGATGLADVDAVSGQRVWAVGSASDQNFNRIPYVAHCC